MEKIVANTIIVAAGFARANIVQISPAFKVAPTLLLLADSHTHTLSVPSQASRIESEQQAWGRIRL